MIACINLPALPLQLLLQENPGWLAFPMAVVDRDAPTGKVLWVNQKAWHQRIRPGMRYAAALSLAADLRAGLVEQKRIDRSLDDMTVLLKDFSPSVEPSVEHPGLFWVSADGLGRLYASIETWADAIEGMLADAGYRSTIVVGYDRFAVSALALARHRGRVMESPEAERRVLMQVPLERLKPDPKLLDGLHRLGVRTLGQFMRLPRAKVAQRFGEAAERLYVQAHEGALMPVQTRHVASDVSRALDYEHPERNTERLLFAIKAELPGLVGELLAGDDLLAELRLALTLERGANEKKSAVLNECVRPANPTLDEALILDLVRLKLESLPLPSGVVRLELLVIPTRARREQTFMLSERPKRDLAAADRAIARLRAELGDDAVGVVLSGDGHLPESRMQWQPIQNLRVAAPARRELRPLVRRIALPPTVLPPRPRHEPDGWLVRGPEDGPVVRSTGPHVISGGWWATEIHREYHYLETTKGMLLWAFFDRRRRRWYLQGDVD